MKIYYHGSVNENLNKLETISKCNENPEIKCAYITDNYAYSLFYIRDMDINIVTAWVNKTGIACYEEQFENQLEVMYKNKSGYIYSCENDNEFIKSKTNGIYYSKNNIELNNKEYIADAYESIQKQIDTGNIIVKYYKDIPNERLDMLYEKVKQKILDNKFFDDNEKLKIFYKTYYSKSWNMALNEQK